LEQLLAETPADDEIDRASLEARIVEVERRLASEPALGVEPVRARLTFRGRPVIGSHGVFATFGSEAVRAYSDCIATLAASLSAPLAATGPLPKKEEHQLVITGTALGSFGFVLEEPQPRPKLFGEEPSFVVQALERTQSLLLGSLGTDDELAEAASEIAPRALDKVRSFLTVLADNEAVCAVALGDSAVRFEDVGQVRTSLARLSQENLREEEADLTGIIQGVLPKARVLEFLVTETAQVLRVRIGAGIADPAALNALVGRTVTARTTVTRVGGGRPRHVLVSVPVATAP
jgi:hypothetical protein